MKFDYIIGNPPYQMEDGGAGASATPVYNKFIDAVKELDPSVLSLIIPAKWYSGGKGLDQFRQEMLNDSHIRRLADYTNSLDVFPDADIAGGVCIFVRDKSYEGGGATIPTHITELLRNVSENWTCSTLSFDIL
ncbi:Eco57I restriction-modification methylase domain-containing protein [Bifidobacterium pseudocatenulatum]|uniref:Eco57I restriction-modification methylase domain-containing protein n=1 Tax=Bifidobacterium pseudocatenulatum TaxID=28026 RepID=UPI0022DFC43C|nr:Eco57I restriction-modification methylase domain-containing protein [Bifidobacterium pseudocatenulatum]